MPTPKSNDVNFTVQVADEKDYGAIKHRMGYSETFNTAEGHTYLTAYAKCQAVLDEMFADYEANILPQLKQTEYKNNVEKSSNSSAAWYDATEFAHEQKNGKDFYNVKTGRWQKFGVACWPECDGREEAISELGTRWTMPVKWKVQVDESGKYPKCIAIDTKPF